MSRGINKCVFIGNLGADPESRQTASGMTIATLNLAVGERVKKNDQWEDHTEWVRCVVFGRTAETAAQYLGKGSQVFLSGKLRTRKWEDAQGQSRWTTEVVVDEMLMLGGKGQGQSQGGPSGRQGGKGDDGDGIPF